MSNKRLKQPKTGLKEFTLIILLLGVLVAGYLLIMDMLYSHIGANYRIVFKIPGKGDYIQFLVILAVLDTVLGNIVFPSKVKERKEGNFSYFYKSFRIFFFPLKIYLDSNYRFTTIFPTEDNEFPNFMVDDVYKKIRTGEI